MTAPRYFGAEEVAAKTPWPELIGALDRAFRAGGTSPERQHHEIAAKGREPVTLLQMPAWNADGDFGVKLAAIAPSNRARGLDTLNGVYVLFCGETGVPRALLDAGALTARRTAAASALASRYLSRADARTLLVIGTGRVALNLVQAHCAVRSIREVRIWGRNPAHAREFAERAAKSVAARCLSVADVQTGAEGADIISSATPATQPLLKGAWVAPGTHVDLVGAYTPAMCEADTALVAAANAVYVDTRDGAMTEAGDLIQAAAAGRFSFEHIAGNLFELCTGPAVARENADQITFYKSVGVALQDLAAALLCAS